MPQKEDCQCILLGTDPGDRPVLETRETDPGDRPVLEVSQKRQRIGGQTSRRFSVDPEAV